jgi:transposase
MTSHREELAARALRLRTGGEGMSVPAVARELGISASYAYDLLSDPTGERHRANRRAYDERRLTSPCVECRQPAYGRLCWYCSGRTESLPDTARAKLSASAREVYARDPDHPFKCAREGRPVPPKPPPPPKPKPVKPPKPKREPVAERLKREAEPRRRRIQALWLAGYTPEEIAARIGATANAVRVQVNRMRRAGWDMPYQRHRKASTK